MPALSFPASPTVGQTYSANGRTWSWTGSAWELVAASSGGLNPIVAALVFGG